MIHVRRTLYAGHCAQKEGASIHWFIPQHLSDEKDEEILQLLASFHQLRHIWSSFRPPGPIRRSDFMLLGVLAQQGGGDGNGLTVSSLARLMRQSVPGISQRVRELEQKGYLTRSHSAKDRRTATLHVTPAGMQLLTAGNEIFIARLHKVLAAFGEENTTQLLQLLQGLQQAVEDTQQEENETTC